MSEEILHSVIQSSTPSFCSRGQRNAPPKGSRNTRILDVSEFHEDRGRVRFEIDEFDGAVPLGRIDSIAS